MRQLVILFIHLFIVLSLTNGNAQGYKIGVKINGLKDTSLILGHYLNKSMYPDDTTRIDSKGQGVFTGKKALPQGMYLIYLPDSRYFEVIMGKDQDFNLEVDTTNFLSSLSFKGSDENSLFVDFQRFMQGLRSQADSLTGKLKTAQEPLHKEELSARLRQMNEQRIKRIEEIVAGHPDYFASSFLRSTVDVKVPDPPKDEKGRIIDSTWQYYYFRNHYFDNFDISDPRMLRTPLYEDKIMTYLNKVVPQVPDSLIPEVDRLIEKSRSDSGLFRFMLITLFNHYGKSNIMGMDAVQMHIAEKYYLPESWWSDEKFMTDLKNRVAKSLPLLIGKTAPDMELMLVPADHFKASIADTSLKTNPHVGLKLSMHQLKSKYLVLLFWEAECAHCKKAVPDLYRYYEQSLKDLGVSVLAISTLFGEDGKKQWIDFINEHGLYNWLNAWNPYSYQFKLDYDILSTPQIFLLDENKKILAKKIGPEQVEDIVRTLTQSK